VDVFGRRVGGSKSVKDRMPTDLTIGRRITVHTLQPVRLISLEIVLT